MFNPSCDIEHFPPITFVIHAVYRKKTPPQLLSLLLLATWLYEQIIMNLLLNFLFLPAAQVVFSPCKYVIVCDVSVIIAKCGPNMLPWPIIKQKLPRINFKIYVHIQHDYHQ